MPIMNCKMCGKEFEYNNGLAICANCAHSLEAEPAEVEIACDADKARLEQAALDALAAKDFFQVKKIVNSLFYGDPLNSIANYCQLLCEYNASEPFELKLDHDWEKDTFFARALRCCTGEELEKLQHFSKNRIKEFLYRKITDNYRSLSESEMELLQGYKDADLYIDKANAVNDIYAKTSYEGKKKFFKNLADNGDEYAKKYLSNSHAFSTPCLPKFLIKMLLFSLCALWASFKIVSPSTIFIYISGALLGFLFWSFRGNSGTESKIWAPILGAVSARVLFYLIYELSDTLDPNDIAIGLIVLSCIPLLIYGIRFIFAIINYFQTLACYNMYKSKLKPKYDEMVNQLRNKYTALLGEETINEIIR